MTIDTDKLNQEMPVVGILGDGQLAMMMAEAYQRLGGMVFIFGASDDGPASYFADKMFLGDSSKAENLLEFFEAVDLVTLENEFNDSRVLSAVAKESGTQIFPDPSKFGLIEDKLSEKQFFESLEVNVADYFEIKNHADLLDEAGYLKLAKGGYDGIGTYRVEGRQHAVSVFDKIRSSGKVLFERAINYKKELSLIVVSDAKKIVFYPIVETYQEKGTCRFVSYPCVMNESIEKKAQAQVERIIKKLDTKGLFAFEFFLTKDDELILNESAPRPHNSGHITLDLNDCSQFENHMRAVAGLELKQPQVKEESMTMVNLLGTKDHEFDHDAVIESIGDAQSSVTLYRKKKSRIGRKMGHVNLWGPNQKQRAEKIILNLEV